MRRARHDDAWVAQRLDFFFADFFFDFFAGAADAAAGFAAATSRTFAGGRIYLA